MNFYSHTWKSFIRNERWRRNLLTQILLVIFALYITLLFLMLGLHIDKTLVSLGGNPVDNFNSILLWYLTVDLFMRCLLQPLPTIEIIPYLRFRIRRKKIINYLLVRSVLNVFNYIPLLVVIPFSVKLIMPQLGTGLAMVYLSGFILLLTFNNFLALFIGFLIQKKSLYYSIPFGLLAGFAFLSKSGFPVSETSIGFGSYMLHGNLILFGALLAGIVLIIYAVSLLLIRNFYIDEVKSKKQQKASSLSFDFDTFKRFGEIGRYLSLEVSLLSRNKRPRQMLVMLPIFLAYFLFIFSTDKNLQSPFFLMLILTMLTGIGASMYGQFLFSWESSYFDCIMSRKNNFVNYVKAKYYLLSLLSVTTFIPLLIYFSLTKRIDIVLLCAILLFIVGVNNFIFMFFGTFNNGRIDLGRSQFFNYQGVKGNQFLISFLFMLLPTGLYSVFDYFINATAGKLAIAIPGLMFIIFHDWWIKRIIVPQFITRKYRNLEGYRKLSM